MHDGRLPRVERSERWDERALLHLHDAPASRGAPGSRRRRLRDGVHQERHGAREGHAGEARRGGRVRRVRQALPRGARLQHRVLGDNVRDPGPRGEDHRGRAQGPEGVGGRGHRLGRARFGRRPAGPQDSSLESCGHVDRVPAPPRLALQDVVEEFGLVVSGT